MTAQEYLAESSRLYLAGDYAGAAVLYSRFAEDFGGSQEAAAAILGTRFRHAMCLIRLSRFQEAEQLITSALKQEPPMRPEEVEELQFWFGVCKLEEHQPASARAELEKYLSLLAARPSSSHPGRAAESRASEALFLIGSSWLQEGDLERASASFEKLGDEAQAGLRSGASLLTLHFLLQKNRNEEAAQLCEREAPRLAEFSRLAAFQILTLELANRWAASGEFRKAIACLHKIWPSEKILSHQNQKLAALEMLLTRAGTDPWRKRELGQLISQIRRDIADFQKIPDFDISLRLRLSSAYQSMGRHREAALIIEDLIRNSDASPILEQAGVHLVQTWFQAGRWEKVAESATSFRRKFPSSPHSALVMYLEATAAQKDSRHDEALALFDQLALSRTASEFAPRAAFMRGFTLLLAGRASEAAGIFEKFQKSHAAHEMVEAASYWRGMALSMAGQHQEARDAMDDYLRRFPSGANAGAALFRKAFCAQQLENFQTSIRELRSFLKKYPEHAHSNEARILLGDALMSEGEPEEGITVLRGIPAGDTRCYEEATFKIARALRLMEEYDRLLDAMHGFLKARPGSSRTAEAILQIAWVHRQRNAPEAARNACWEAIRSYGDDPAVRSVEQLFPELAKSYGGQEIQVYLSLLKELRDSAPGRTTLEMRTLWAEARALKKSDPARSDALLLEAASKAHVQTAGPAMLLDFAAALRSAGRTEDGLNMYRELLRWNPRAPQKDRALAELGFAELAAGREPAALAWFDRFAKETTGSPMSGRVLLARGALLEKAGRKSEARQTFEDLLGTASAGGREKAEALYRIGEIHMGSGNPRLAIPYFQRIYVMHSRWSEWAARAYARSAEAFEMIKDPESARRTYEELASKEELAGFAESATAREKLEAVKGGGGKEDPQG